MAPSPSFLGKALLAQAKRQALTANTRKYGFGGFLSGNGRRGYYFERAAYWEESEPNHETGSCSVEQGGSGPAIEKDQSAPHCAGQPGTEGDFATAYGSPRPSGEPVVIQIGVACQDGEVSSLALLRPERMIFSGQRSDTAGRSAQGLRHRAASESPARLTLSLGFAPITVMVDPPVRTGEHGLDGREDLEMALRPRDREPRLRVAARGGAVEHHGPVVLAGPRLLALRLVRGQKL